MGGKYVNLKYKKRPGIGMKEFLSGGEPVIAYCGARLGRSVDDLPEEGLFVAILLRDRDKVDCFAPTPLNSRGSRGWGK